MVSFQSVNVGYSGNIPIEILALGLNVGHAISYFPLLDLSGRFFLTGTHNDDCCAMRYKILRLRKKYEKRKSKVRKKSFRDFWGLWLMCVALRCGWPR